MRVITFVAAPSGDKTAESKPILMSDMTPQELRKVIDALSAELSARG